MKRALQSVFFFVSLAPLAGANDAIIARLSIKGEAEARVLVGQSIDLLATLESPLPSDIGSLKLNLEVASEARNLRAGNALIDTQSIEWENKEKGTFNFRVTPLSVGEMTLSPIKFSVVSTDKQITIETAELTIKTISNLTPGDEKNPSWTWHLLPYGGISWMFWISITLSILAALAALTYVLIKRRSIKGHKTLNPLERAQKTLQDLTRTQLAPKPFSHTVVENLKGLLEYTLAESFRDCTDKEFAEKIKNIPTAQIFLHSCSQILNETFEIRYSRKNLSEEVRQQVLQNFSLVITAAEKLEKDKKLKEKK